MTIQNIEDKLVSFFREQSDTFAFPSDVEHIQISKGQLAFKNALVLTALKNLEKASFIQGTEPDANGSIIYVLLAPSNSYTCKVELDSATCLLISEIINTHAEATKQEYRADKYAINSGDIQYVCLVTAQLLENQETDSENGT